MLPLDEEHAPGLGVNCRSVAARIIANGGAAGVVGGGVGVVIHSTIPFSETQETAANRAG